MKFSGTPGTVVAALLASASLGVSASTEHYAESLSQFMLADSKVLSRFSFDTTTTLDRIYGTQSAEGIDIRTSDAFPRAVSSVIRAYGVGELHLSLTSGRWDYGRWETPEALGTTAKPPGAELQAWLQEDSKWNGLTHALSGLFCTSLAKMDAEHTVRPLQSFQPASPHLTGSHTLQHALLPLEHPCTENLTPFISLLPCRNLAGLASLPDPHFLFDANYQSMSVHITTNEADQIALSLQVEVVSDPVRMERKQGGKGRRDWSHKSLFGRELQNLCPVSQSTDLSVKMGAEQLESTTLKPGLEWWQQSTDGSALRKELGTDDLPIRLSTQWKGESFFTYPHTFVEAPVSVKRVSSGYGEERGSLGVLLHNAHPYPVHAVWLEELPWWIKLYVHTLSKPSDDFFQTFDYRPARDRQSVTVIEAKMTLPPNSSTLLQMDYDKAYLRYTEYPPDAHRGLAVPPAVLTYWPSTGVKAHRVYSTSSLLMAPLPDFSMPYNVIVLTCTVLALAFGTIFNIIQRQFVAVDLNSIPAMASAPAPKPNLFSGLGGLLRRRKAKVA